MTDLSSVIAASIIQASSHPHKLSTHIQVTGIAYEKKKKQKNFQNTTCQMVPAPNNWQTLRIQVLNSPFLCTSRYLSMHNTAVRMQYPSACAVTRPSTPKSRVGAQAPML